MTNLQYWVLLLVIDGVLLFMGLYLILGKISKELKATNYHYARAYMGGAFIVAPITSYLYYFTGMIDCAEQYSLAINLTDFYCITVLMSISYLTIIGHKRDKLKWRFSILVISSALYLMIVWLPVIFKLDKYQLYSHVFANIMLLICIISVISYGCLVYRRAIKRINNYYSDDAKIHIAWVANSMIMFIGLGIIAAAAPFTRHYSTWLRVIYLAYQLAAYIYIFSSLRQYEITKFALSFTKTFKDEEFTTETMQEPITANKEVAANIKKGLDQWIKQKKYTQQGLTLKSVALDICTNRTYLSNYINTTYNSSFKSWITNLRINEAKRLMQENKNQSINSIASKVGFASASSFNHIFRNQEGVSPNKWKEI